MSVEIQIEQLEHALGLPLPAYETQGSAGMDLLAALAEDEELVLLPGKRALIPTGLRIALPIGHEAQIRPRSGLAINQGLSLLNSPGTIDSDYRGEIKLVLVNFGEQPFPVRRGMRIAQMVVATVTRVAWVPQTLMLKETARGTKGFGSTGL